MQSLHIVNFATHNEEQRMNNTSRISQDINQAAAILKSGGLVAFATETVYGLGADASNPEALKRVFTAKGRPADHPLIVHLADASQMTLWAQNIPDDAWKLAQAFWPGPLTLILERLPSVPDEVTGGLDTIALRIPEHPLALELLNAFGSGIAAPSANRYGQVSPTSALDVQEELGERVDLILDGGRCTVGIESTIIDLSRPTPRVLRPGKITQEELCSVLGGALDTPSIAPKKYPGSKPSHYSPRAEVILSSWDDVEEKLEMSLRAGKKVGLLSSHLPHKLLNKVTYLTLEKDLEEQAHQLYHHLRQADHLRLEVLVAVMPQNVGVGHAVRDRLRRAAGLGHTEDTI